MTKNLLVIVACGLALCGCASSSGVDSVSDSSSTTSVTSSSAASSSASASRPGTGDLSGVARMYGGPITPSGKMALNGSPGGGIHVKVSRGGRVVATVVTGGDGRFAFHLAPGRYVVSGCTSFTVVVRAGATAAHDLDCPVP
jgi:hypothetical protein